VPAVQPARFTVFGGAGFIGSHLVGHLRDRGHHCDTPGRDQVLKVRGPLGHVVYCIGLTADFRSRPFDTVEAHTGLVASLLRSAQFDSFLYLSSARIYQTAESGSETAQFAVDPTDPSQLYNLTKLTAESLCLSLARPEIKVARLSNVYGPDFESANFLAAIVRDAVQHGAVSLETHPDSAKDYVAIGDVTEALERIALQGRQRIYNVAAGRNVTNAAIVKALQDASGCTVEWAPGARPVSTPVIATERLRAEFGYAPRQLPEQLASLVALYRQHYRQAVVPAGVSA
jgi:nucleoside-diphosphate-sugar epimerase